jgi:hypothetical protein
VKRQIRGKSLQNKPMRRDWVGMNAMFAIIPMVFGTILGAGVSKKRLREL